MLRISGNQWIKFWKSLWLRNGLTQSITLRSGVGGLFSKQTRTRKKKVENAKSGNEKKKYGAVSTLLIMLITFLIALFPLVMTILVETIQLVGR